MMNFRHSVLSCMRLNSSWGSRPVSWLRSLAYVNLCLPWARVPVKASRRLVQKLVHSVVFSSVRSQPYLPGGAKWKKFPDFCLFFPIFPLFPRFFLIFSRFFLIFPQFFLIFSRFLAIFKLSGVALCPPCHPSGYATGRLEQWAAKLRCLSLTSSDTFGRFP